MGWTGFFFILFYFIFFHFLEYQQRMTNTIQYNLEKQHCYSYYLWYGDEDNLKTKRQFKSPHILSCIILKKTWFFIRKLFLRYSIFHYISNWSKVLEFYVTSFWRVKFRNFLSDLPVHYSVLFINRTINDNYMTLLMSFHHTHDGFR